jgi:hypothetical protein
MNLEEYIKTVGDYADQVAVAKRQADQNSMDVARAMDEVYESGVWVDEWLEQKPAPKRPTSRWDPKDRNRFISWQAWKLSQSGRRTVTRVRSYQMLEAVTVGKICKGLTDLATVEPAQPLFWMRKNRYEDRLPEVWAKAVTLAGDDPKRVTSAHTREALAEWKKEKFGKRLNGKPRTSSSAITQAATAAGEANRLRRNAMDEVREMYRLAAKSAEAMAEWRGFFTDLDAFLDEHKLEQGSAA